MVHKDLPRGLWGNTISSWQFGIYREAASPPASPKKGSASRRLRCCVVAAMATVGVLLVSIVAYDVVRGHGSSPRDVQRLLVLKTSTATVTPTISSSSSTTTPTVTTTTEMDVLSSPVLEEPENASNRETPGANSITFIDENTKSVSPEQLRAPKTVFILSPDMSSTPRPRPSRRKDADRRVRPQTPHPFLQPPQRPRGQYQQVPTNYAYATNNKPYAQLTNYKYPNDAKNIQDIIKYLTTDGGDKVNQRKRHNQVFAASNKPKKAIKFSGVYLNPQYDADDDHGYNDSSEGQLTMGETMVANHRYQKYVETGKPSSLNGHAYIADPFHNYKPSNPAEVNLLANSDFRFAPSDNVIHFNDQKTDNRQSTIDKYFPRPPINFKKPSSTPPSLTDDLNQMNKYPGTYTSAIYKPFGKQPEKKTRKRTRPFSIMLDIYPMTEEEKKATSLRPVRPIGAASRPRPAVSPPIRSRIPYQQRQQQQQQQQQDDDSETRHQMIVHLNLYPKKKKQNTNSRSDDNDDDDIPSISVSVEGANNLARIWQQRKGCQDSRDGDSDYTEDEEHGRDMSELEDYFSTDLPPKDEAAETSGFPAEARELTPHDDNISPTGYSAPEFEDEVNATALDDSSDLDLMPMETDPYMIPSMNMMPSMPQNTSSAHSQDVEFEKML